MKMKKRIPLFIVCALVLAALLLAPFPTRVEVTLPGTRISADGEEMGAVTVQIKVWKLRYLIRQDKLRYTVSVSPFEGEESSTVEYTGGAVLFDDEDYYSFLNIRDTTKENGSYAYAVFAATPDFQTIRIDDETDSGHSYVASGDSSLSAEEIYNLFPLVFS
ncbi:MAG: hypothetical protein LUE89_08860 [Clostridiales bacterium]|nr:hypothetical protein [Clostridiales bacterium]